MPAILFGSISTVIDTSELQREAFNRAFAEHGLDWSWDREEYIGLLEKNGGRGRVEEYAVGRGEEVDAEAVHATKSRIFVETLTSTRPEARPGVLETIRDAKAQGQQVALVTTTSPDNVAAIFEVLAPAVTREDFDVVVDATSVSDPKPDPAAYAFAVERLGVDAGACVAVEDNVGGVRSAEQAGVGCVAFPNQNTARHDFADAHHVTDRLTYDDLAGAAGTA